MADSQVPLTHLNVVDDLVLLSDVVSSLKVHGVIALGADGHCRFVDPGPAAIASEAVDVMALLEAHGVQLPDKARKLVAALPAILPLLGL